MCWPCNEKGAFVKFRVVFLVMILLFTSCTSEKSFEIQSIDENLALISDKYDEVYNIKMTYIDRTIFFNVRIYQNEETFDRTLILDDLQNFLLEKTHQDIIRDYHEETYLKDISSPLTPVLKIALISYGEKFPTEYYGLYIEESDDGYGHKTYKFLDEWHGPLYDKFGD